MKQSILDLQGQMDITYKPTETPRHQPYYDGGMFRCPVCGQNDVEPPWGNDFSRCVKLVPATEKK